MNKLQNTHAERWLTQRALGRVHCLDVDSGENKVVVRGQVESYHMKRLILQALEDLLSDEPNASMDVDVSVVVRKDRKAAS